MSLQPRDRDFDRRVRASFAQQSAMRTLGALLDQRKLVSIERD